jgi:hypothetical protein
MVAHNDSFTLWDAQEYVPDSLKYLVTVRRCICMRCVRISANFLPKLTFLTSTMLCREVKSGSW